MRYKPNADHEISRPQNVQSHYILIMPLADLQFGLGTTDTRPRI